MSRGVVLSTLRTLLKAELKDAQETNTVFDTELNYALANGQKKLASSFDWPFLQDRWDATAAAGIGNRYVALPTTNIRSISSTINLERPLLVERKYNSLWAPIDHGIGSEQYNWIDSDSGRTQDPIQRWQLDTNTGDATNADQFEVWPVPVTSQTVRFTGQRAVRALSADADKADLDDLLIVYFAAMEYLTLRNLANSTLAVKKFNDHFITIRGTQPSKACPPIVFGKSYQLEQRPVKLIATATS